MQGYDKGITKIRRRRKGGGRKPKPPGEGKAAQFQARIAADLRAALNTEAAATGLSVSAIASGLLREGLRAKRERELERGDPMRALWYLIAEVAKEICGVRFPEGRGPGLDWRANPFAHETLKLAIMKIMDALRPAGGIRPPAATKLKSIALSGPFNSVEARAAYVAEVILHNLERAPEINLEKLFGPDLPADVKARLERTLYNMSDARKALLERPATDASQALPRAKSWEEGPVGNRR